MYKHPNFTLRQRNTSRRYLEMPHNLTSYTHLWHSRYKSRLCRENKTAVLLVSQPRIIIRHRPLSGFALQSRTSYNDNTHKTSISQKIGYRVYGRKSSIDYDSTCLEMIESVFWLQINAPWPSTNIIHLWLFFDIIYNDDAACTQAQYGRVL